MSPIHPEIFRVGKTSRWKTDNWTWSKSSALTEQTIKSILQSYLGDFYNLYIMKCILQDDTKKGIVNVSVVFYKYIQRVRIVKSRRMILLLASGAIQTKLPIYHVRSAQGFVMPSLMVTRIEKLLQTIFGKTIVLQFFNISQLAEVSQDKLTANITRNIEHYLQGKQKALTRSQGKRSWPPVESRIESNWINPITLRDSYRPYKAYNNLAYLLDVILITLYTSVYSTSELLADVIARGLLRNMKRHKQFLRSIETAIEHFRTFENWPYKPFDWCIGIHGKIGSGKVRSRSYYIKTGFLPLQTLEFPLEYSYRQVDTKFGSIGIKIWIRRQDA